MFIINKQLALKADPFKLGNISGQVLEATEQMLSKEKGVKIVLFDVNFKELHPRGAKLGYRYFHIKEAFNQRDK